MKKLLFFFTTLMLLCLSVAVNAQSLADYTFSTGQDQNKWITLSSNATSIVASSDDANSAKTDIGFTFSFGDNSYTQFWANSNGVFSFNSSTATDYNPAFADNSWGGGYTNSQPKICGITRDMSTRSNGYVKYELTGTTPNRVLVCEFKLTPTSSAMSEGDADISWQVQLHEADAKVVIVYDAEPSTVPTGFQIGLSQSSSDIWTINPSTHEATHATGAVSTTYSTWPGEYRYYKFSRPVIAYPKPTDLHVTGSDHESVSFSWVAPVSANTLTGYAYEYKLASQQEWDNQWTIINDATATTLTIHGLDASSMYDFRIKALYGNDESENVTTDFSTTAQALAVGEYWSDDFEGTECGWELINGTLTNKWCWGTAVNNGGTHALYISNDNGANNNYSGDGTKVFAAKLLNFTDGKYTFAYDWHCYGEDGWDFLRVALVPASATLTAGSDYSTIDDESLPTGWIALDGGSQLNLSTTWQNKSVAVNVTAGNYYLVLVWRNDVSAYNPAAAVDNVSITKVACEYEVENIQVISSMVTTTNATIIWDAGGAQDWQVALKAGDGEWEIQQIDDFPLANEGAIAQVYLSTLTSGTHYQARVRANCGNEQYGAWSEVVSFDTECEAISADGYSANFDDYTAGNNVLPLCWRPINTTTNSSYTGYPKIYNYNANSPSNCLYLYSYAY